MHFWRYDLDEALVWMAGVWWKPTSRPALAVVVLVTGCVLVVQKVAALAM